MLGVFSEATGLGYGLDTEASEGKGKDAIICEAEVAGVGGSVTEKLGVRLDSLFL